MWAALIGAAAQVASSNKGSAAMPGDSISVPVLTTLGDNRPIYNQSLLGAIDDVDPLRLAMVGILLFGLVLAWRKR